MTVGDVVVGEERERLSNWEVVKEINKEKGGRGIGLSVLGLIIKSIWSAESFLFSFVFGPSHP